MHKPDIFPLSRLRSQGCGPCSLCTRRCSFCCRLCAFCHRPCSFCCRLCAFFHRPCSFCCRLRALCHCSLSGCVQLPGYLLPYGLRRSRLRSRLFRQLKLVLILSVERAVLQIPESGHQLPVLIDAPNQPGGELVHDGVLHEQVLPGRHAPLPPGGQRHLQAHLLAGDRGFHLLLHLLEFLVGSGRLLLIVPLAGGGQVLQLLAVLVEDLYLQGRGDGHGEFPLAVIEHAFHILIEAHIRHNPVRQFLRGDVQLGSRKLQGFPSRSLNLLELEFAGNPVYNQEGLGLGAQGQGLHRFRSDGSSCGLGPFLNLVMKLLYDVLAAVDGRSVEHPALLGLRPRLHPFIEQFIDIDGKLFFVQCLGQGGRRRADAAGGHGRIA